MKTRTIRLDGFEQRRVEDRAYLHWKDQQTKGLTTQTWEQYWQVNKRHWLHNGLLFKAMLNESNFNRYLFDHDSNPWTLWNIQTMNG